MKTAIKREIPYKDLRSQHIYRKAVSANSNHQWTLLTVSISNNSLKEWKFLKQVYLFIGQILKYMLYIINMMANDTFYSQRIKEISLFSLTELCLLHINKSKSPCITCTNISGTTKEGKNYYQLNHDTTWYMLTFKTNIKFRDDKKCLS